MTSEVWTISHENQKKILVTHVNVRQSIVLMIARLVAVDILSTFSILVFFSPLAIPLSIEIKTQIVSYNIWYFVLLFFMKFVLTLFIVFEWLNEYYEITPTKIFHRRGIILRKEDIYDLSPHEKSAKITSIGMQQGFLGRIFNYGTLFFYDRGEYKYYYLHYIHNPSRYFTILRHLLPNADIEKDIVREHIHDEEIADE